MPARDLALLAAAAAEAGPLAMRYWKCRPQVWEKPDGAGPVTEADLAVNDRLETVLRAARPDYGWLSEESADDPARLAAARIFVIDPIDGTRAFVAGEDTFSLSLAVAEAGRIIAAVVHLPARGLTYAAEAGGPALLNGREIRPSTVARADAAEILAATTLASPANWRGGLPPSYRRAFRASIAYRLCLVAEGRFDGAVSLRPTWEWDIAAGSLIAARAGAVASDRTGAALVFNRAMPLSDGMVVAPPALHADLTGRLAIPGRADAPAAGVTSAPRG